MRIQLQKKIHAVKCRDREDGKYMVIFTSETSGEALRTIGRWAGDPSLSLSWYVRRAWPK